MGFPALAFALVTSAHPKVEALPVIARIDDIGPTVLVLRGNLSKHRASRMRRFAREVYEDLDRRFINTDVTERRDPVDVVLFETTGAYQSFVDSVFGEGDHSNMGFYSPGRRLVVANLGKSVGNLRHELAHPLIGDDFPGVPSWLNEGIASLYGNVKRRKGRLDFTVNYRLRHLRQAKRNGSLPAVNDLARSTHREVYGPDVLAYYAVSRYLLLYLDRRGQLSNFYRELRAQGATPASQLVVLRRFVNYESFLGWTTTLTLKRAS